MGLLRPGRCCSRRQGGCLQHRTEAQRRPKGQDAGGTPALPGQSLPPLRGSRRSRAARRRLMRWGVGAGRLLRKPTCALWETPVCPRVWKRGGLSGCWRALRSGRMHLILRYAAAAARGSQDPGLTPGLSAGAATPLYKEESLGTVSPADLGQPQLGRSPLNHNTAGGTGFSIDCFRACAGPLFHRPTPPPRRRRHFWLALLPRRTFRPC